jgi:anhydro-N-acetylmuramic acid kinase
MNGLYAGLTATKERDGINIALINVAPGRRITLRGFRNVPFAQTERIEFRTLTEGGATLDQISMADSSVGALMGAALLAALAELDIPETELRAAGSKGIPLWIHAPDDKGYGSLTLGSAAEIAVRIGCPVINHWSSADLAVGGYGGPVNPAFLQAFLGSKGRGIAVHHIGALSQIAYLNPEEQCELAFDTGPGTILIDALRRNYPQLSPRDEGGEGAGSVSEAFLAELLHHAFFKTAPPKSVGHDDFSELFIEDFIRRARWWGLSPADQIATATALTLRSMADAYRHFVLPKGKIDEVIVAAEGVYGASLVSAIGGELHGIKVSKIEDYGLASDAVEAASFAYLAYLRMAGLAGNIPAVTGASRPVMLGAVTDLRPVNSGFDSKESKK